jgi:hypothetical protein
VAQDTWDQIAAGDLAGGWLRKSFELRYLMPAGYQMEHEKLKKSFELRYLMPAGYQMEHEKLKKSFEPRYLRCISVSGGARKPQQEF